MRSTSVPGERAVGSAPRSEALPWPHAAAAPLSGSREMLALLLREGGDGESEAWEGPSPSHAGTSIVDFQPPEP